MKAFTDAALDTLLDYAADSDYLCVCSTQPTTYTEAYVTYMLAKVALTSGDFTKADATSGRKVTVGAKTGTTITNSGDAQHFALVKTSGTTLRGVTTCTLQHLYAGGTVDTPAFIINILDPS